MLPSSTPSPARQARAAYAQLPEKWRRSVVGMAYGAVLDLLDGAGFASQEAVLETLLPGLEPTQARRMLMTQYINRPYQTEQGRTPLRLHLSRASKNMPQPAQLWFVAEPGLDPAAATPDNNRYQPDQFEDMLARQTTGQELQEAAQQPRAAQSSQPIPSIRSLGLPLPPEDEPVALRKARYDMQLARYPEGRAHHGLRRAVAAQEWQDADASAHDMRQTSAGQTVNCLQAMLAWTQGAGAKAAPRLLVLLGDYGTGKTSHAVQYSRVLNAEVPHPAWALSSQAGKAPPRALYVDLAQLAGISELARLSLHDLLGLMLTKQLGQNATSAEVDALMAQARAGELVMVYDGLDELLGNDRQVLHNLFGQLLKILEPDARQRKQAPQPSQARIIISCRTHYFRDVEQQHAFFDTRKRGIAKGDDYLCLTLLPWSADNVRSYLAKRLPQHQAQELAQIIDTTYNLQELASRPVLLAMMCEQVGSLLRQVAQGQPVTAAQLYTITVAEWIARDDGKHRITAFHKPLLMGALAAALWNAEAESWSAQQLDAWVMHTLATLFPGQYSAEQAQALQDDLRTATFIVRTGSEDFSFAHRSFAEYFLARFLIDALQACCAGQLSPAALRPLLPERELNRESMNFLQELWAQVGSVAPVQGAQRSAWSQAQLALPLWQWLQEGGDARVLQDGSLLDLPYQAAPALHASLWAMAVALKLHAPGDAGETVRQVARQLAWEPLNPINLRGLQCVGQQWQGLAWRGLPPLDCRGTNFLALRAHGCQFGVLLCDGQTNWAQALLRDCNTDQVQWRGADRQGLLVRSGDVWRRWPAHKAGRMALQGPWNAAVPLASIAAVAFSPDGRSVLTGSHDNTARLWSLETGQNLRVFQGHYDSVTSVAFSPDGRSVLTGSVDKTARLWGLETGQRLRTLHLRRVSSVAFSPDGRSGLTGSYNGIARLWKLETGQSLRTFERHGGTVSSVAFSPDGRSVLTGSNDKTARLWSLETGQSLHTFEGHDNWVRCVAFSPDGRSVLTGSYDDTARLWSLETGQSLRTFEGHGGSVSSVAFSPDNRNVLTGSYDDTARLWSLETSQSLRTFEGHGDWVTSVAFSPDSRNVLTGSYDDTARLWSLETGRSMRIFEGHGDWVASVAFRPDGRSVLTGSQDNTACLWSLETGQSLRTFEGHGGSVSSVAFSPDGRSVLTGSYDKTTRLWSLETGQSLRTFEGHGDWVTSVAFSPDGRSVLTGSDDKTVRLWGLETGQSLRTFEGHGSSVTSIAFSPDGRSVLTGSDDNTARLWSLETGQSLHTFQGHSGSVTSVAFSPDGRSVLTGSVDTTARLWSLETSQSLRTFEGHGSSVTSVAYSPDGRSVLTGSGDNTGRLWSLETSHSLSTFEGHGSWVKSVAFSPDGLSIALGHNAGAQIIQLADPQPFQPHTRVLVHGLHGPSTALFDCDGNLLDCDNEAADTWLYRLGDQGPEPMEFAPGLSAPTG